MSALCVRFCFVFLIADNTFCLDAHYVCYTMLVQRSEPQGRHFTNFHYYYWHHSLSSLFREVYITYNIWLNVITVQWGIYIIISDSLSSLFSEVYIISDWLSSLFSEIYIYIISDSLTSLTVITVCAVYIWLIDTHLATYNLRRSSQWRWENRAMSWERRKNTLKSSL